MGSRARDTAFGPYTARDLDALPEGGKGFELEEGWLVEIARSPWHNWAATRLAAVLHDEADKAEVFVGSGGEWEVSTPAGIRKPDVFMVPREVARAAIEDRSPRQMPGRELLLVAEVVSPGSGSERTDRVRKVGEYAGLGIPQYWIVDLDPHPRVQVLRLGDGIYRADPPAEAGAMVTVTLEADKPFEVAFDPGVLARF